MRRITEFKGFRSTIEYDHVSGEFVAVRAPEHFEEPTHDDWLEALARVMPISEVADELVQATHQSRKSNQLSKSDQ